MKTTASILLFYLLSALQVQAQQPVKLTVTGTVSSSETNQPLAGASVFVKGTSTRTATTDDGRFSIRADKGQILEITFIGFATKEYTVKTNENINLILTSVSAQGDEVVVIGYGTVKKSSLTGAVAKYKNEKLEQSPVSRLDQALQGKIAGVQVTNIASEAGSDPKIQVRGVSSINAGQGPLVVVDGHPVPDGLAFVNMADVESVEVLKDAASAAIYGSRGASGVILVTTKTGKAQKPTFSLNTSWGFKNPYKTYPIMSTSDYATLLYKEAALRFADTGFTNYATAAQITAKGNFASAAEKAAYLLEQGVNKGVGTDWQAAALRTGQVKNIELSVSGGSAATRYFVSGAYQNDQGMMIHSEYQRFNLRSRIDMDLSSKLKLSINLNPSYIIRERPATNFTDFTRVQSYLPLRLNADQLAFVLQNPANTGLKVGDFAQPRVFNDLPYSGTMPDGSIFTSTGAVSISTSANNSPYSILETEKATTADYRVLSSADLTYNILPGLNVKSVLSVYIDYTTGLDFAKSNSAAAGAVSKGTYNNRLYTDLLNENTVTYDKQFGKHSFNVLAGFTSQQTRIDNQQIIGLNYQSDNVTTLNTALSIDQNPANTYNTVNRIGLLSYLGRINYAYDSKYLLSASFRSDGSSKFAPGNKYGYFPSLSLGWVASKEKFLQGVSWISNLKLRGSYGATGNNNISDFLWLDQLFAANYPLGTGNGTVTQGLVPSSTILSNPDITWERTYSFNGGLDLSVFKNAVTLSLDVYESKTEKLLLLQSALGSTGVPQVINNIGKLQNDGIELEISTNNIRNKNFRWTTSANISHTTNKILQLGNETQLLNTGERQDVYLNKVGGPLIQFYNFKTDGIWLSQAAVNAAIAKGQTSALSGYYAAGALKFVDVNGDNKIDLNDRVVLGNPYPDFTYGITNSFNYKGFDLSFTVQGVQGGQMLNGDGFYNESRKYNHVYNDNRWVSPANPGDGKTPYFTNGYTNAWTQSDYIMSSASYWSLRELLFGYTVPAKLTTRWKLKAIRFYVSAQNLYYHFADDYKGLNPEARSNGGLYASPLLDGYQRGAFPINRTILIGLNMNF